MADYAASKPERVEESRSGWPQEEFLKDEGAVRITGRYKDASLGERALGVAVISVLVVMVTAAMLFPEGQEGWTLFIAFAGVGSAPLMLVVGALTYFGWRRTVDVKIGPEFIVIAGRRYARDEVSEFRADLPRKARKNIDRNIRVSERLANEKEVVMQYGERVVPIAHFRVRDLEMARALVLRLQAWHDGFNRLRRQQPDAEQPVPTSASERDEFGPAPPIR